MLINEMMTFYYVAQFKSFSQAALQLKVSKSQMSKEIVRLEHDLKIKLLNRSTRQVSLTEEGQIFFKYCRNLIEQAKQGYGVIEGLRAQASGTLKISVPPAFALHVLSQPLLEFSKSNPKVKLNIVLDSRIEDIIEQGYDLALRSAVLSDSNLIAQKVVSVKNVLCASPAYLKTLGKIQTPEQLSTHRCAVYSGVKLVHELKFYQGKKLFKVEIDPVMQSNSADFMLQMVLKGDCVAIFPEFMVTSLLHEKKLIACLPDYQIAESPLYAIYPDKEFLPLRVKLFIETLKKYMIKK